MPIQLKPQLIRLDTTDLLKDKLLLPVRQGVTRLQTLIKDAEKRIEEIKQLVSGPAGKGTAPTHSARLSPVQHKYQPIKGIDAVKQEVESQGREIVQALDAAARLAEQMAERHWSIRAMLRRARPLNLAPGGGVVAQSMALRAHYAEVLKLAGPAELAAWGQQAIDDTDPVLMDAVLRANDARKRDERAFMSPGVLELFAENWTEYKTAKAILDETVTTARRGGLLYAEFQKGTGQVAVNRIALGLRVANSEHTVNESGEIVFKQPDNANRLDVVGAKLRQLAK